MDCRSRAEHTVTTTATSSACKPPDNAYPQKGRRLQCLAWGAGDAAVDRRTRGALLSGRLPPLTTLGTLRAELAAGNARSIGYLTVQQREKGARNRMKEEDLRNCTSNHEMLSQAEQWSAMKAIETKKTKYTARKIGSEGIRRFRRAFKRFVFLSEAQQKPVRMRGAHAHVTMEDSCGSLPNDLMFRKHVHLVTCHPIWL
ncbi:hypothetical protein MTO96_021461 [Rhipicephalus appendiculatus]